MTVEIYHGHSFQYMSITLPCQRQSSRRFEWAGLQRKAGSLLPFHTLTHLEPTSLLPCCIPINIE